MHRLRSYVYSLYQNYLLSFSDVLNHNCLSFLFCGCCCCHWEVDWICPLLLFFLFLYWSILKLCTYIYPRLEWKWKLPSSVQLFATPWSIQSMEFSRSEYYNGYLSLLQGIFPTQGSNPGLPHCRWILYQLSHQGSPGILEQAACPFSSRSSQPRNWTGDSCITGRFFTSWPIREAKFRMVVSILN